MRHFSFHSLIAESINAHQGWKRQWRAPEPKPAYDAVIVGGGGHGLATAYYMAKEHGMRNIAVVGERLDRRRQHRAQHDHYPLQLSLR